MNNSLVACEALSDHVIRVKAASYAGELLREGNEGVVCAVFEDGSSPEQATFLGVVPADVARLSPTSKFRDLAGLVPAEQVSPETGLADVSKMMASLKVDVLPVCDAAGRFIGAVTVNSAMRALLGREHDLLEKSRAFKRSVQDDKRRRNDWLKRLEQMNRAFGKVTGLLARPPAPDVFQRGVEALALVLQAQYGAVSILDQTGNFKESIFTGMAPGNPGDVVRFFEHRKILLDEVVKEDKHLLVPDVPAYLRKLGNVCRHPTLRSFVGVPISREGDVFGCVYFCDRENGEPFIKEHETLVSNFAQGLSLVFSQMKEREQRKRVERERDLIPRLALELGTADTPEKLGEILARVTDEFWAWDCFFLTMRRGGHERFKAIVQKDKNSVPEESSDSMGQTSTEEMVREQFEHDVRVQTGEAVLINRNEENEGPLLERFGSGKRSRSLMFAPVRMDREVLAVISVQSYTGWQYTEADTKLLQQLADTVGPALARCQAEKWTAAFSALGLRLNGVTTPQQAAEIIVNTADELLSWDACSVYLYSQETEVCENVLQMDIVEGKRVRISIPVSSGPGPLGLRAINEGPQLVLRDNIEFEPGILKPFGDKQRPSASLMYVPLRTAMKATGILSIQSYTKNAYTQKDLQLLQALADHCSGALERTRLGRELKELMALKSDAIMQKPAGATHVN